MSKKASGGGRGVKEKDLNDEPGAMDVQSPMGNGIDVVMPVESIWAISERFMNTAYGFFFGKRVAYPNPNIDILKEDVGNVPVWVKLHGVPVTVFSKDGLSVIAMKLGTPLILNSYTYDIYLQSWDRSSYAKAMIELWADVELKDNIMTIPKKPTTSLNYNKKKGVALTSEVSNSNLFDVLKSVDNDVEFGTNEETTNLGNNGANSSGSSFMNVKNSNTSNTLIFDKIRKFEDLLIDGQDILVDEDCNHLKKVEYPGDDDSEDEVASVDNDMAHSLASERVGLGTQSLLEQWRDSYCNGNYDEDPYDDDMYEGQDLP
ncbi:exostosin-like protein [Tanacetum coccineum]